MENVATRNWPDAVSVQVYKDGVLTGQDGQ